MIGEYSCFYGEARRPFTLITEAGVFSYPLAAKHGQEAPSPDHRSGISNRHNHRQVDPGREAAELCLVLPTATPTQHDLPWGRRGLPRAPHYNSTAAACTLGRTSLVRPKVRRVQVAFTIGLLKDFRVPGVRPHFG